MGKERKLLYRALQRHGVFCLDCGSDLMPVPKREKDVLDKFFEFLNTLTDEEEAELWEILEKTVEDVKKETGRCFKWEDHQK
ncbi:MAG: hypothetical protein V2G33_07180 [bacterium JZ-2024 1]